MTDNEKQFENFVRGTKFDDDSDPEHRDKLEQDLLGALTKQAPGQTRIWRPIMKTRISKLAAAAVIAIIVLGGVSFWPSGSSQNGKWWLGPPATWGQEILSSLERVEALIYRQRIASGGRYDSAQHMSGTWSVYYKAKDKDRKDQYYEDTLVSTEWSVSERQDLVRTIVSFEFECYKQQREQSKAYNRDPVDPLRQYVKLLDGADRILGTEMLEERECVGFEVSAGRHENDSPKVSYRIWFDVETKLPVRIETHGLPVTNLPGQTSTSILDQFEYYVELPVVIFTPEIPEGFIDAHPDEIRAARQREEKGEMIYANIPPELKEDIVAALNNVETGFYREGSTDIYFSRYAWRKDSHDKTEWYVIEQDMGKTSFDPNDRNFRLMQTIVNFTAETYKVVTYGRKSRPTHPIDSIWFPVGYIDRADCILENREIEGVECFGVEISAKKYGTNPDGMLHRLWLGVESKLPVRMEFERLQDNSLRKTIKDQFEWNPELSDDTFIPQIPEGFTVIDPNDG